MPRSGLVQQAHPPNTYPLALGLLTRPDPSGPVPVIGDVSKTYETPPSHNHHRSHMLYHFSSCNRMDRLKPLPERHDDIHRRPSR